MIVGKQQGRYDGIAADVLRQRYPNELGIAIGPILFVVAILGILAAAIAAGSGAFTGSTAKEGARVNAAAVVEISLQLKHGVDRLVGAGVDPANIDTDVTHTTCSACLFAPDGGGLAPPSVTLSGVSGLALHNIAWKFDMIGTPLGPDDDLVAGFLVPYDVCLEINYLLFGNRNPTAALAPTFAIQSAVSNGAFAYDDSAELYDAINTPSLVYYLKESGCLLATDIVNSSQTSGYFYRILAVR